MVLRGLVSSKDTIDVPSRICVLIVQLRLALFAVVFEVLRDLTVVHDSHTATVLPNATPVALNEQRANVIALRLKVPEDLAEWWTRVIRLAANAPCDLFVIAIRVIRMLVFARGVLLFRRLRALTPPRWLADIFARERVWCCRLV
jgi:hypothetical protein